MPYGNLNVDVVQSSTANTPVQFNDGNGTQVGTLCRAWVYFTGSSGTRNGNFNVSSVTRNGTGDYTVNFTTALPDANYAVNVSGSNASSGSNLIAGATLNAATSAATRTAPTTSAVRFIVYNNLFTLTDLEYVYVSVFR